MQSLEGQSFGDYEIQAKLGQGGMGAVYKAQQTLLKRTVALKVMAPQLAEDPAYAARFVREAAAAANLNHPNMVLVYTAGKIDGTHYIAMEYVEGESLRKRLDREGRLDSREAVAITVYITQALQYAWNKARLIHRDIKPDNIFLSSAGEVKVGDLGLAKSVGSASTDLTASGMAMGSPHYISPEQARGLKDIDFRADIYSLGCTLYHMLTGRTPYDGDDSMSIMMKHVNDPPPAIFKVWPQCPMPLGMLVGRMLAKDRNTRHRSYEDLLADLLAVHEKLKHTESPAPVAAAPAPARAPTPPTPVPVAKAKGRGSKPTTRNSKLVIGGGVAVATVVIAAGLLLWSPWKTERGASSVEREASSASRQPSAADSALRTPHSEFLGKVFTNSVGAEMVYIPPGEFLMGSTKEEQAWAVANGAAEDSVKREGEGPHKTSIKQGFWLGRTEVTVRQWKQFVAATGHVTDAEKRGLAHAILEDGRFGEVKGANWRDPGLKPEDSHPVTCVSWNDAVEFCKWLTEQERKTGRLPAGHVIRLPSEAEWEYACRAGTQTKFWWGDTAEDGDNRLNWIGTTDGFKFFSPVDHYGTRGRNAFGLADMLGNVYEWCLDEYDATQAHEDPFRGNPKERVARGGCFCYSLGGNRCACRNAAGSFAANAHYGFRVCYGVDVTGTMTAVAAAPKETGVLAPVETRVTALTATPKAGEVCMLTLNGGVSMELMGIPPGEFMMGSTPEEQAWVSADGNQKPSNEGDRPRKTRISQGFWLGRTEVTAGQWKRFVATTGYQTDAEKKGEAITYDRVKRKVELKAGVSWKEPDYQGAAEDHHPVRYVSWNDAMAFCEWLTKQEKQAGRLPKEQVIRLPTEAEWEYTCRAGTQTKFWWGDTVEGGEGRLSWFLGVGSPKPTPADSFGERGRNGFGLADMLGNVREWCLDEYDSAQAHEECYEGTSGRRVLRDGAFFNKPTLVRSASRGANVPSYAEYGNGFRICVGPDVLGSATTATAKETGVLAPTETRVSALTANPKVGEVCALDLAGGVTMELMGIPPGEFLLGSTPEERAWANANGNALKDTKNEGKQPRKAAIRHGFWLGKTEATVGQWKSFVVATGYVTDDEKKDSDKKGANWQDPKFGIMLKDNHPACRISWNDAMAFCEWLSDREAKAARLPSGFKVRLPTEAEWEYACRAGKQTKFWWGDTKEGGDNRLNWSGTADGFEFVSPVDHYGTHGRNKFGLADMLGNVREWCLDVFDPSGAHEECNIGTGLSARVVRGGSFNGGIGRTRCAFREICGPSGLVSHIGFRVCVGRDVLGSAAAAAPTTRPQSSVTSAALDSFCREVAVLPAEAQVQRVVAKLKELNPGFDGKVEHTIENGQVTYLWLSTEAVTNVFPIHALSNLNSLLCGKDRVRGILQDLSPLKGMQVKKLDLRSTQVSDLSPLAGMKLNELVIAGTRVVDLSPLKGMPLLILLCGSSQISDLSPLQGMPLNNLRLNSTKVTDLTPIKSLPLTNLAGDFVLERDAEILRSIKTLKTINDLPAEVFWKHVAGGVVPTTGGRIPTSGNRELTANRSAVVTGGVGDTFIREVAALPAEQQVQSVVAKLKELNPGFDGKETHQVEHGVVTRLDLNAEAIADISPVQALRGLRHFPCPGTATHRSRLADISPLRGLKLVTLDVAFTSVEDIGVLEGMPLEFLRLTATKVGSVTALKGMPLRLLFIAGTSVRDLSPLRGLPLEELQCDVKVEDLSPLKGLPLKRLSCGFVPARDTDILRSIKTLETINTLPVAEFWRKVDASKALRAK